MLEHCHPFMGRLPGQGLGGAGEQTMGHRGPGLGEKVTGHSKFDAPNGRTPCTAHG